MNASDASGTDHTDFARLRVISWKHNLSVTADVSFDSLMYLGPNTAAELASCEFFTVKYLGNKEGLHTFAVLENNVDPKDPEATLRNIKVRLETFYDRAAGERLLR